MRKLLLLSAACLACIPLAFGQNLPELGDISSGVLSPQTERRIGEQAFREIRQREPQFLDDPEITEYVSQLGSRLALASSENRSGFEFFMIQDASINAFAMPGGFVGV